MFTPMPRDAALLAPSAPKPGEGDIRFRPRAAGQDAAGFDLIGRQGRIAARQQINLACIELRYACPAIAAGARIRIVDPGQYGGRQHRLVGTTRDGRAGIGDGHGI